MGSGSISYKKLPKKQKVYGDKEFFVRPKTYGLDKTFEGILIRPASNGEEGEYSFDIEGEFSIGAEHLREERREYRDVDVKYIYFKDEAHLFTPEQLEEVELYCDFAI